MCMMSLLSSFEQNIETLSIMIILSIIGKKKGLPGGKVGETKIKTDLSLARHRQVGH